ncbi:hypothetical protein AB0C65_38210 [Nocardia sp. NPDC048505]|uniref:hypothetical protein n=1 Tax=Nocardia sp. NPDC048505 TaxID=3155756 RepID=UPI0033F53B53
MRVSLLPVAALAGLFALISAPELVIGSAMFAAFVYVLWRMAGRGLVRRGVRR